MSSTSSSLLQFIRRDTPSYLVEFVDENDDPIDITGQTLFFTVKKKITDSDSEALIQKNITSHLNPAQGQSLIQLSSIDTDVSPNVYFWDLQLKDGSTISSTLFGRIKVTQDITVRVS